MGGKTKSGMMGEAPVTLAYQHDNTHTNKIKRPGTGTPAPFLSRFNDFEHCTSQSHNYAAHLPYEIGPTEV